MTNDYIILIDDMAFPGSAGMRLGMGYTSMEDFLSL
jgi:hypothetical protein